MSHRLPPSDDDINAFRQALKEAGVRRIKTNRADTGSTARRKSLEDEAVAARRASAVSASESESTGRTSDGRVEPVLPSEYLDFALPDLPWRTRSQLKRGEMSWEAGLDLHGYRLEEARQQLESFLNDAQASGQRCVLVVHGKAWGASADYPVIKSHVNAWLREWPSVLAFCSATDADGGTGAVYILLRKRSRI
ncbi:Smr/MutS family protein [Halomonas cupida]|uniref:DNA mismatch repair protein MutS n=1 Tax=Halomonas cupida TaxID=44933 RepID=A0A1M7MXA3_9GAMM|nr:Smr/MutS family protein [Halomonas cupida]GEN25926.1 DNA mismatch repair protein MutS [Halomonas cupida]SHM95249.1 DNA-nicking endonuclease, Smr domain [Halomonas cupida]